MVRDPRAPMPAVSQLLAHPTTERLMARFTRDYVVQGCRDILEELQRAVSRGHTVGPAVLEADAILARLESRLHAAEDARLERVVNATGVVLHPDLGGPLLPEAAIDAVVRTSRHPFNLEYDLTQGGRGRREQIIEDWLMGLTRAEGATVVNSHAAALLLLFDAHARGRDVVVSRGDPDAAGDVQLRDIAAASGATLREVGTPEGAAIDDYARAVGERTAFVLRTRAQGDLPELAAVAKERGIPVIEALDDAALVDVSGYGLPKAPVVAERIAQGAAVVVFGADGLVGGPQAGLVAGEQSLVLALRKHRMHRALRCGGLVIAALEATLRLHREAAYVLQDLPALRALARPLAEIEDTALRAMPALASALGDGFRVYLRDETSPAGGGVFAGAELPTKVIVVEHDYMGATRIAGRFRQALPPIVGRIKDHLFLLDARAVSDPLDLVPNWSDELEGPWPSPGQL